MAEKPDKNTLEELNFTRGPDTLERDLAAYWYEVQREDTDAATTYWAFTSIMMIAAWGHEKSKKLEKPDADWGLPPCDLVPVPWWVLRQLAPCWLNYINSPAGKTFGEAFNLEGGGQGKQRYRDTIDKFTRDWKIALDVLHWQTSNKNSTLEQAIFEIADNSGLSDETIKRAWNKYKERVKPAYEYWVNTSGSDDHDIQA